jgi:hypothetical protein
MYIRPTKEKGDMHQKLKKIKSKAQKRKLQKEKNLRKLGVDVPSSSAPKIGHAKRRVQTTQQRLKATMKKQEQKGEGLVFKAFHGNMQHVATQ